MGVNRTFIEIDKIVYIDNTTIVASKYLLKESPISYLESVFQTCSLHVRWLIEFKRHTFLLKVNHLDLINKITGHTAIKATLLTNNNQTYKYKVSIKNENKLDINGTILIGSLEYTEQFKKSEITNHYKGVINCLLKDI